MALLLQGFRVFAYSYPVYVLNMIWKAQQASKPQSEKPK